MQAKSLLRCGCICARHADPTYWHLEVSSKDTESLVVFNNLGGGRSITTDTSLEVSQSSLPVLIQPSEQTRKRASIIAARPHPWIYRAFPPLQGPRSSSASKSMPLCHIEGSLHSILLAPPFVAYDTLNSV